MLPIWEIRILFLIFSLLTITKSTKLLSGHKKCGDPECETFMSRVLAIKDYIGPDCRYLNFKTGEEIIVYSKLSRKREDLWAGSKGAEFGYFPVDAVRIEETFITKEVELPTKETDFLCIDGGEYVFENEDSILNHYDKENEYIPPYSEEKDTKFEMPEDEVLKLGGISYPNEYKEQFPDSHESDSKYKDLHTLETTSHGDTELRDRETRQDETTPEEDQISQTPQAVPTQSAWTVSGFVGWLGLGSNENEEAVRKISQKTEEVTFRRRKIAITDDSGLKKLNEDGETAPQGSSWFKSTFTDLMHLGSDKSELDLLYKENDPEIHDSSAIAANAGHHGSSAASEGIKEHSNSEQSESSWFDLEFSDILPFRYAEENAGKEKLAAGGEVDQDEEQRPSEESSLIDDGLRKQTGRLMPYEEQDKEKIVQETPEQAAEPTLYEGQVKEKYDQEAPGIHVRKTDSDVQSADEHADVKDAASPSPLLGDKRLKSPYAEQDSIPDNQVMENNKIKAVTKESERTNDQSGWYESMYNSLIDYNRVTSDNQPGHEYVTVESPQESAVDQLSYSIGQGTAKEENHEGPKNQKSLFSVSYFTSVLNFQSFIFEGTNNAQHAHNNLKSSEESTQFKKSEEVLHIGKEELLENQNITEKVPENRNADTTQGNVLLSSLAVKCSEESRRKRQGEELAKDNTPHPLSVKSIELEHQVSYGQCTGKKLYGRPLDTQGHSNIEDKNNVRNLEAKQQSSLELQKLADLAEQKDYISETYSYEKSILGEDEPHDGKAIRPDNVEQALFSEELNEHSDSFSKSKNIPGEDKIPLDEDKPVIQGSREFNTKDQNPFLTEQHEAPELTYSVRRPPQQQYKAINKDSKSSKCNVNKNNCLVSKVLNGSSRTPVIGYTDVMKGIQVSDPVPHLHSKKRINNNIRADNVVDSHDEKKLPDVKNIESVPSHAIQDYFHINPSAEDEMNQSVVTEVGKNLFSQESAKEQNHFSQHITELSEGKQGHNEQNTSSNQGPSPLSGEVFQSEKEISRDSSHILNYDSVAYGVQKKGFQGPQVQIGEKGVEEEQNSKAIEEHLDSAQVSDASLIDQQEQSVFPYPSSSGTFSKKSICSPQMCASLTHEKEDKEELKGEQVSSSYLDCQSTNIMSLVPDKKCISQKGHDRKQHLTAGLEVKKLRISAQHKKIDSIPNTEETKPEYQKQIAYTTSEITDIKPEDSLATTEFNSLPQKQYTVVGTSPARENPVQHLEVRSDTSNLDNNINPSKHLSHHLQPVDDYMYPIPPHAKDGMDTQHLAKDHHDETFAHDLISPFPKNLNHAEKVAYSGHARDSQEKGKTGKDSEKKLRCKNIDCTSDKTEKGGVGSNIFGKISRLLGEPFKNKDDEDSKKYEDSRNIIGTQIKTQRQEADVVRSDFEQDKGEVQSTKAIRYLDNFKIKDEGSQGPGERDSNIQGKSVASDSKNYNQKYDRSANQETIVQNGQLTADTELDLKEATSFSGLQELYFKFVEESKRILEANMCERHELQLLEQEFEKLRRDITTFPCEDIRREMKDLLEHENKLNSGHEKCLKDKVNLLPELQSLVLDIRNKCEIQKAESGMTNNGKLPDDHPKEKHHLNLDKEPNSGQHTEANNVPPVNTEKKIHTSAKNSQHQPNSKRKLSENNLVTHNYTISNEREWLFQIILHLNDFCAIITSVFSVMASTSKKVLAALPENMKPGPDLYGFPWEMVICGAVVAVFTILLLMCRSYQSIRSRLYVGREKQLASKVAELVEDKCKVLEKLSLCKKEYEELENSLKDGSLLQGLASTSSMKAAYEELSSSNSALKSDIECLEKELKEEKSKRSEQDDLLIEIQRRMESLENEAKSIQMQVAEAKSTLKVYEINRERLKISVQDAIAENNQLHESEKQLLKEAEGQSEQLSELNEQAKMLETSKAGMEETLKNKESQVKSLTECLLKMKDWSCTLDEHAAAEDNHWDNDIKTETENGEHLDDQEKRTVKKLIYAAKLNACLKSMESEVNQICSKLTDENKAKEELAERIENLQKEHVTLHSENTHFESEVQKLQQKLKVMTELYQENEMNLHRKLTVEEKDRLQKEEKLSKVDETISHAAEEVNRYRQRAEELEEELKKTVHSYENLVKSHEQKAHDNWLAARAAERHLSDIREENAYNRQKLTEAEFKFDRLEKDPYALDMPVRAFGREHSPYGPSPMGRPSSETRAFLSPPTLLEGPLRFSPVLPGGGGGRGSRGPGNAGMYEVSNERGELHSDRLSDPHRPPSDTGSLSPPWDRDHRIMPPPAGQLYNEQSLPRRPERFYPSHPNSGRLSGPAELRSYSMPSYDKADGQASENNSGTDLSGNGIRDHPNDSNTLNASDQSHAPDNGGFGPGIVPPQLPLLRAPLMPMDPRGPFMRRGPPFPPVPPSGYGPREYFPRDFAGLPRPLLPMRGPFPVRPYSQYPPPRAGFFPPLPPESRNEMPAELAHPSTASSATPQESQQET
ncbi:melanoma inhibitory activity protein 2 isoform X1 [Podarcis raffonei]|uniref:melanoma inhibitory activity protein 2 isoform X1 n=2 Tax=Podarcis raffonei TaxID=65483 RepID=UPI00232996A8|nr:melanoma inhibitory activity protein 2 isoform X1 [Podarcis raffonei]XP_053235727.1 melanoma inhibitory activity protein 2 isoform X1 [Podarcis raffonei]